MQLNRFTISSALATALWLAPLPSSALFPSFESLEPVWAKVEVGMSAEVVATLMGDPTERSESSVLGVSHTTYRWFDIRLMRYEAKFVAKRLYAKALSRSLSSSQ